MRAKQLYDEDIVAWSREQADALRAEAQRGSNRAVDWVNVADEIESLGISQRRELRSQIRRIIEHLLKLRYSPSAQPRRGWLNSIADARNEIEALLEDSPSLKNEIGILVAAEHRRGARKAVDELQEYGEFSAVVIDRLRDTIFTQKEILGGWVPLELDRPHPPQS